MMLIPRLMFHDDLFAVHSIETAANRFPWSLKNFEDSLNAGQYCWVYCDADKEILAYAIVQNIMDEAHLLNICVAPHKQGQGLGRRIMAHIIEQAQDEKKALMVLEVRASNTVAQRLYEQQGFNEMSVRRGYYPAEDGREDAILMGLDIGMLSMFGDR